MAQRLENFYRQRNWELATEISLYLIGHPKVAFAATRNR